MGWTGNQAACRCANWPFGDAKRARYGLADRWQRLALTVLMALLSGSQPGVSVASSATLIEGSARYAGKTPLVVSLIAPRGVERTVEDWTPFLRDLSRVMEQPVELRVGKSQRDVVDDMLQRRADIAWLGNAPALEVVEAGAAEVFASMVRWDGGTGYRSVIVTHRDSPLKTLDELLERKRRLSFAMGDPKSTSGYVVPNYYVFARNKVIPEQLFARTVSGNHLENALRVARREVDAGVCNDSELAAMQKRFPDEHAQLRVLWQSAEIPESPLLWRLPLPDSQKQRLRDFFVRYGATEVEQNNLVKINNLKRFRASSNRQLLLIADIEMFNARTQIDRDPALSLDRRGERHQEVVQRAVRLETALRMQSR